jgi:hypothetical protein
MSAARYCNIAREVFYQSFFDIRELAGVLEMLDASLDATSHGSFLLISIVNMPAKTD